MGNAIFCKTAIDLIASKLGRITEVLFLIHAIMAVAASFAKPRDSDPVSLFKMRALRTAFYDFSYDLVPWDQGKAGRRQFTVNDV
jgi:hypothetical protein